MKIRLYHSVAAGILCVAAGHHLFGGDQTVAIPTELKPPAGNELYLKAQGVGTQDYICLPSGANMAWSFLRPQATLFVTIKWPGDDLRQQVMTHFLSPNPQENGTARATWQSSLDSSAAWARAIVTVSDSNVVAPGAIPWLLLEVVGKRPGMYGLPGMAQTTFIQRVNTLGGVAPATGCAVATDIGNKAFVPYTTDYHFYRSIAH